MLSKFCVYYRDCRVGAMFKLTDSYNKNTIKSSISSTTLSLLLSDNKEINSIKGCWYKNTIKNSISSTSLLFEAIC